jgi:hypothetical protein
VGFVLIAVGAIWIGQGLGLITGGSFMVGDVRWAAAGLACVLIGLVLVVRARRSRPR